MINPTLPEVEKPLAEMAGYFAVSPDDWAQIEQYIFELEIRADR